MQKFKYTTVTKEILGDLYTPVSTYLKVRDLYPQSALMESSDYHSHDTGRSFIALSPMASIAVGHGTANANYPDGSNLKRNISDDIRLKPQSTISLTDSKLLATGASTAVCMATHRSML